MVVSLFISKVPSGPLQTNAYLLGCPETKIAAVIDPSPGSATMILQEATKNKLTIQKILLTHSHWDHFADAHLVKSQTGAALSIHPLDKKNLEEPGSDGVPLMIPIHPVSPDSFFQEGHPVEVGSIKIEVIHTPGHCPGSVCLYLPAYSILFSGDTLFRGAIGNLHLPTGEPEKMEASLQKLASLPPETRVLPGHGGETKIKNELFEE